MAAFDALAPANVEAEQAVLGSLLIDTGAVVRVAAALRADDFSRPAHGRIYEAVCALYEARQGIDLMTVANELKRRGALEEIGGPPYLTALVERTPVATHVEHYAALVERAAVRRRLIDAAGQIARIAYDDESDTIEETIDQAESTLFQVLGERRQRDLTSVGELLDAYFERIEEIQQNREEMVGTGTGFRDLDRMLGGLQPSDLCIVAGRPGLGQPGGPRWLRQRS